LVSGLVLELKSHLFKWRNQKNNPRGLRTDIRIQGPGAPDGVDSETDVKITCVSSLENAAFIRRYQVQNPMVNTDTLVSRVKDSIDAVLEEHAERKKTKYAAIPRDFVPLLFSSGGTIHPSAKSWFKKLNTSFPRAFSQRLLYQDIGVTFLRCRTATFLFDPY
jgi:hypothetical protein